MMSDALKSYRPSPPGAQLDERTAPASFHGQSRVEQQAAGSRYQPTQSARLNFVLSQHNLLSLTIIA